VSAPKTPANQIHELEPGILHWSVHDERIDFRSDAYAIDIEGGTVVIDPLPLEPPFFMRLGRVTAILLTGGFHQRAAWEFRRRLGAPVRAPKGAQGLVEEPDSWFEDGARLGEGLTALHRPGPTLPHYVFHFESDDALAALFCADLLMRDNDGPFRFVPDEHQDDPKETRRSVRRLTELQFELLCPAHGAPALHDGVELMRKALAAD